MHGLISDRFLKRFVGGIFRRRKLIPPQPEKPAQEDGEERTGESGSCEVGKAPAKKEAEPPETA